MVHCNKSVTKLSEFFFEIRFLVMLIDLFTITFKNNDIMYTSILYRASDLLELNEIFFV